MKVDRILLAFSTVCNYDCPFCCTKGMVHGKDHNHRIPLSVIDRICEEYDFDFVEFSGTGETTYCVNFLELFFYALGKEKIRHVTLYTNGVAQPKEYWLELIDECAKYDCEVEILFSLKVEYPDSPNYIKNILPLLDARRYNNVRPRLIGVINDENREAWIDLHKKEPELVNRLCNDETGFFEIDKINPASYDNITNYFASLKGRPQCHVESLGVIGCNIEDMNSVMVTVSKDDLLEDIHIQKVVGEDKSKSVRHDILRVEDLLDRTAKPVYLSQKTAPVLRVVVPFPNNSAVHPKVRESLRKLNDCTFVNCRGQIVEAQGASISVLRNNGINNGTSNRQKQKFADFDYILCLDSDIEFKPEDVKRLIDQDKDIISGAYQYRKDRNFAVAGIFSKIEGIVDKHGFVVWNESGLREVDWVGAGFLLIKRHVFEAMNYPYFRELVVDFERYGVMYSAWVGEDVGFCLAAKKAGFKIWVDMDVKVNHLIAEPFESNIDGETNINKLKLKQRSNCMTQEQLTVKLSNLTGEKEKVNSLISSAENNIAQLQAGINEAVIRRAAIEGAILQLRELIDEEIKETNDSNGQSNAIKSVAKKATKPISKKALDYVP